MSDMRAAGERNWEGEFNQVMQKGKEASPQYLCSQSVQAFMVLFGFCCIMMPHQTSIDSTMSFLICSHFKNHTQRH